MDDLIRSIQRATSGEFPEDYSHDDLLRLLSAAEEALKFFLPPEAVDSKTRFDAFRAALNDLCARHCIQLSTSQYEGLQAWPLRTGESPVYSAGFENCIPGAPNA